MARMGKWISINSLDKFTFTFRFYATQIYNIENEANRIIIPFKIVIHWRKKECTRKTSQIFNLVEHNKFYNDVTCLLHCLRRFLLVNLFEFYLFSHFISVCSFQFNQLWASKEIQYAFIFQVDYVLV